MVVLRTISQNKHMYTIKLVPPPPPPHYVLTEKFREGAKKVTQMYIQETRKGKRNYF